MDNEPPPFMDPTSSPPRRKKSSTPTTPTTPNTRPSFLGESSPRTPKRNLQTHSPHNKEAAKTKEDIPSTPPDEVYIDTNDEAQAMKLPENLKELEGGAITKKYKGINSRPNDQDLLDNYFQKSIFFLINPKLLTKLGLKIFKMEAKKKIKILARRVVSDFWGTLQHINFDFTFKNGRTANLTHEVYGKSDGVALLLFNKDAKTVLLTRQFRMPMYVAGINDGFSYEVCGGSIDDGETPEEALVRETKEELNFDQLYLHEH